MKFFGLFFLLFSFIGCSNVNEKQQAPILGANGQKINMLYYSRCISKYKNRNYIDLEEKCKCGAEMFTKSNLSLYEKYKACSHLGIEEGRQIVDPVFDCEKVEDLERLKVGDYIQEYRSYDTNGWVNGIEKKDVGTIWQVKKITAKGVDLALSKGKYYDLKIGDISRRSNSITYQNDFPDVELYDQAKKSFKLCINPNLL